MAAQGSSSSAPRKQLELTPEDFERYMFFESARKQAEKDYAKNNQDTQALTRWGGSLLELAHFRQGTEAIELIEAAILKFEEALQINPKKHDALWCLGNALTSQGFLYADAEKAGEFFTKAADNFRKALAEEPNNEVYKKALEMTAKAPALHLELQKQLAQQQQQQQQQAVAAGATGAAGGAQSEAERRKELDEAFTYDVLGWLTLAAIAVGWIAMARRAGAAAA